jgi:fructose 1,6-bisphosphate aldolase/phosphatase
VSCAAFSTRDGKLTGPIDAFDHPFWDRVRDHVSDKAMDMRRQGFFGAAMLPMNELEYTGIIDKLAAIDKKFTLRTMKKAA